MKVSPESRRSLVAVVLAGVVLTGACAGPTGPASTPAATAPGVTPAITQGTPSDQRPPTTQEATEGATSARPRPTLPTTLPDQDPATSDRTGGQGTTPVIQEDTTAPESAEPTPTPSTPPVEEAMQVGSSWPLSIALLLGGLAVGLAMGWVLGRARGSAPRAGTVAGADAVAPVPSPAPRDPGLLHGLIAVADLTESPAVLAQVRTTLTRAHIVEVAPVPGESFDPHAHNGVGWQEAPTPDQDRRIARVLRPGWRGPEGLIRPADVEVYRYREGPG